MNEALRYLENAEEILKKIPKENNTYLDVKYVQEACSVAYLAVLKAIDEALLKRGLNEKDLPQSIDEYRTAIKKYLSIYDGKLMKEFEKLYKLLHIAGYYRGLLEDVEVIKSAFNSAKAFIKKLEQI